MGATAKKQPVTSSKRRGQSGAEAAQVPVQPRSRAEQYAAGKALRTTCPRNAHAAWKAPSGRRDAVELVLAAEQGRLPYLLPLRHGRMVRSAFTFYRGAALISGYLGKSDAMDQAIAAFSVDYADQNERDHAALDQVIRAGKVKAVFEEER